MLTSAASSLATFCCQLQVSIYKELLVQFRHQRYLWIPFDLENDLDMIKTDSESILNSKLMMPSPLCQAH